MGFLDGVGNFVSSTATLGFCDTSGCSKSPSKGIIGGEYQKITGGGGSGGGGDPNSAGGQLSLDWNSLSDGNKKIIIYIGIGFVAYVAINITIDVIEKL